jgi:predicted transcriptional regulator
MGKHEAKRVHRPFTPEEARRWQLAKEETELDKEQILAEGRKLKASHHRATHAIRDAFKILKAERQAQGLSLSDVEQRTGIGRAALSRLENETEPNPTVTTLTRYAEALGKTLVVTFR